MENNTIFVGGLFLNKVADTAPSFIITNQSIHLETLYNWLRENKALADEKGYIRVVGKESKEGKRYFVVDTWKPTAVEAPQASNTQPVEGKGIDITEFTGAVTDTKFIPF